MNLELILMSENDIAEFKKNVQCAFQKGFEDVFGKCEETILPEKDIDQSLNGKGSVAYKAVLDGETVGGVIVAIDTETQHNHLDLLYVKSGVQGKGIGKSIWYAVEKLYPDTKVWVFVDMFRDSRSCIPGRGTPSLSQLYRTKARAVNGGVP